jgi:myo-inositol catabolism protein IolC
VESQAPEREPPLYLLAFDHRASFSRDLFGIQGALTPADVARVSDAKSVIFEGFLRSLEQGVSDGTTGVLIDEQFGAELARRAKVKGIRLAMPVEASGRKDFDFEYGADFGDHIEAFDPDYAKVLVRYNPDEGQANAGQTQRLKMLSNWLHDRKKKFLFELLVPPTTAQLAAHGGDTDRYDRETRPALVVRSIAELQQAGVQPDLWKIEGLDRREDCVRVAQQARVGGRTRVGCIVLGRAAPEARVDHWFRTAATVPGFKGFAIGRTLWWDALAAHRDGQIDRVGAAQQIAGHYLRAIRTYAMAAGALT